MYLISEYGSSRAVVDFPQVVARKSRCCFLVLRYALNYDRNMLNLEKIVFVLKKDWRPPELHAGMPRGAVQESISSLM